MFEGLVRQASLRRQLRKKPIGAGRGFDLVTDARYGRRIRPGSRSDIGVAIEQRHRQAGRLADSFKEARPYIIFFE